MAQGDKPGFWRRQLEDSVYFGSFFKKDKGNESSQEVISDLTPREQEVAQTLFSKISEKLSLDERQKQTVLVAVSGVVHMAMILFSRSAQPQSYNLVNSPRFGAKISELNDTLRQVAGEDQIRAIDEEVLSIVTEKLKPVTKETKPHSFAAVVKEKGLIINDEQIAKAIKSAGDSANIQTNDSLLKARFDAGLESLVKARAAVLRLDEDKAYHRAEEEFGRRGELLKILNEIKPGASTENEMKILSMISAMDESFGRKQTARGA